MFTDSFIIAITAFAGLAAIGLSIRWLFDKEAKKKELEELRKRLNELKPTDPEYNEVRALYTSMIIDSHKYEVLHSHGSWHSHGDNSSHSPSVDHSGHYSDGGDGHH